MKWMSFTILKCFEDAKVICDPYMGIGTTAKAVRQLNEEDGKDREYIGFEIDNSYIDNFNESLVIYK